MKKKDLITELKHSRYLMGITESEESDKSFDEKTPFEEDAIFDPDEVEDEEEGYDNIDESPIGAIASKATSLVKKAKPLAKKASSGFAKTSTTNKVVAGAAGGALAHKALSKEGKMDVAKKVAKGAKGKAGAVAKSAKEKAMAIARKSRPAKNSVQNATAKGADKVKSIKPKSDFQKSQAAKGQRVKDAQDRLKHRYDRIDSKKPVMKFVKNDPPVKKTKA